MSGHRRHLLAKVAFVVKHQSLTTGQLMYVADKVVLVRELRMGGSIMRTTATLVQARTCTQCFT